MRKRKNDDIDQPPKKKKNGCVMWLAALSLLCSPFLIYVTLFVEILPKYEGVEFDQANYMVIEDAKLLICPNEDDQGCKAKFRINEDTFIKLDENYEYGGTVKDTDLWVVITVNNEPLFLSFAYIKPITPRMAIDIPTITIAPTNTATATSMPPTATLTRTPRPTFTPVTCPNINATCSQLTCAEARACLAAGNQSLDGDDDGQPCESKCR